jgi:hypothetical protein
LYGSVAETLAKRPSDAVRIKKDARRQPDLGGTTEQWQREKYATYMDLSTSKIGKTSSEVGKASLDAMLIQTDQKPA